MVAVKRKRFRILVFLLTVTASVLFLYRYEILFSFQRMQLRRLGCDFSANVISKEGIKMSGCEKFWVHRADSYERFTKLSHYFPGLEADLVFDKALKKFRVYHPPVKPGDLFVETYFEFNKTARKKIWLDIKNLDSTAFADAVHFFIQNDSIYGLKKFIVIESPEINFVNQLARLGFTVSYMVSSAQLDKGDDMSKVRAQLVPEIAFVSQEDIYVDKLKEKFPGRKIITWAIPFKNYFDLSHFRALLADSSIAVVLINVKSSDYR